LLEKWMKKLDHFNCRRLNEMDISPDTSSFFPSLG